MVPITDSETTKRRLVDRLAIGILIGVVAVSVGGAALLMVYLNRIGDAAEGLSRAEGLTAYEGRPSPVTVDGVNAMNYLLLTTNDEGGLEAVLIAHLSASRRDLTLVALPADLLADDGSGRRTLAASYAADPLRAARAVENLTGARMDHQVRLGMHGFADVVDILGGIDLGSGTLDGSGVMAQLASAPDDLTRSEWTAEALRSALGQANLGVAIADPNRFDKVMNALTPCLTVDNGLTGEEIRSTLVESRVRADQIAAWPLASVPVPDGSQADPAALTQLRSALASDSLPAAAAPLASAAASTPHTAVSTGMAPTTPAATVPPGGLPSTADPSGPPAGSEPSPTATR